MAELREQIEREVLAITIGPRPIVDALVDLILEHRAQEAEAAGGSKYGMTCAARLSLENRARELRAFKGTTERSR